MKAKTTQDRKQLCILQNKCHLVTDTYCDLAKVKGPEKRGHVRCRGKIIKAIRKGSCASQVPQLKARVNELENEVKELRETQREMALFMASFKVLNLTFQISLMVYIHL